MSLYKCENCAVQSADFCAKHPKKFSSVISVLHSLGILFLQLTLVTIVQFLTLKAYLAVYFLLFVFICIFFMMWSDIVVNESIQHNSL